MAFKIFVDEYGIPYSDYGTYNGIDIGQQRSILSVAERGLWYWNTFTLGNDHVILSYDWNRWPVNKNLNPAKADDGKNFMIYCADWLVENVVKIDDFCVWKHPYAMSYNTSPGWRSAHSQAVGMQLLSRTAEITNNNYYNTFYDDLIQAYFVAIEDGGLLDRNIPGVTWYEKFADPDNKRPKILNGMLFTIIGLLDIANRNNKSRASELAHDGIESVFKLLPKFDLGDWSAYDIYGKRASNHYHQIHIKLLDKLFNITDQIDFANWRDRFISYIE